MPHNLRLQKTLNYDVAIDVDLLMAAIRDAIAYCEETMSQDPDADLPVWRESKRKYSSLLKRLESDLKRG